jgi:hypothetical protein
MGGMIGTVISIPVLLFIIYVAQSSKSSIFGLLQLSPFNWAILLCLPFVCFAIAGWSSYRTVIKSLGKG